MILHPILLLSTSVNYDHEGTYLSQNLVESADRREKNDSIDCRVAHQPYTRLKLIAAKRTVVEIRCPGLPLMPCPSDIINFPLDAPKVGMVQCEGMFRDTRSSETRFQHIV